MIRATTPADAWHYPRPELAAKYLQVSTSDSRPPRIICQAADGKIGVLEQDLIPAARDAGYLTVYLNLWDARSQPAPHSCRAQPGTQANGLGQAREDSEATAQEYQGIGKGGGDGGG